MADSSHRFCIIVGGGVAGLLQAAELLRNGVLDPEELQLLERDSGYGGVWKAATYPGAACDVFSILYQISWWRNPNWNCLFPTQDELVDYYTSFAEHFGVSRVTAFGQNVTEARWSEEQMLWIVESEDVSTRKVTTWTANVLVQAPGTYNRKVVPDIPGILSFKGDMWHTSDWPTNFDFVGKTVAYVGTGPTAIQAFPIIQPQVKSLKVFCRSMTYCYPFGNIKYPPAVKWAFRCIPGILAVYSFLVATVFGIWSYFVFRPGSYLAKGAEKTCLNFLQNEVPDTVLREKLTPLGRFGSKRPLVSNGFYKVLQRENVNVISDPILRVDETGTFTRSSSVRRKAGNPMESSPSQACEVPSRTSEESTQTPSATEETHYKVDVIIWGTGFKMQGWGGAIPTIGLDHKLLSSHWGHSPRTLHGTTTSSFPNLVLLNGPNTVAPWASIIRGLEYQATHNLEIIRYIHSRTHSFPPYSSSKLFGSQSSFSSQTRQKQKFALMPNPEAEEAWTKAMQPELDALATSPRFGPGYYYLNVDGRNTFFWPWTQWYYWFRTREFNVKEYACWDEYGMDRGEERGKPSVTTGRKHTLYNVPTT